MSTIYERSFDALPQPEAHVQSGGSFWRKEEPVFRDKLVVTGGMFPHQREFYDGEPFIRMLVMGYGGGKSFALVKRMIALTMENAPVPCAIFCPSYPQAKITTIPTIKKLLEGKRRLLRRAFTYSFTQQPPMCFKIRYRGREGLLYVLSSDKPESLKGANLAAVGFDEPFIQPFDAFEQAVARTREPTARRREIILAGTPEQLNWGYDLAEGELFERYKPQVITGSMLLNTALPEDVSARMIAGYDEKVRDAYVHGKFVNLTSGRVYYRFSRDDHVVTRSRPSGSKLGIGMDFNVDPMACTAFWYKGNDVHIIAEYEFPNSDTAYACQILREKYGAELEDIFPDASGRGRSTSAPGGVSDFKIIRDHGFTVNATSANPARRDRYNAVNGKFAPAGDQPISLTIDPKCKKLIGYLEKYTHENRNKAAGERMSHLLDAATYPIAYLFPVGRGPITAVKFHGA